MSSDELKPCPFCGCDRVWIRAVEYDTCINIIRCPDCKMEFTTPTWHEGRKFNNYKQTVELWNTRVDEVKLVRHGRWIRTSESCASTPVQHCSECCMNTNYDLPYCPNCGAKMDGGVCR